MSALVVSGLSAGYGPRPVLDGVDLRVDGGLTAILGPSGCGKTTFLRSVAGFVTPRAGRIAIGGTTVVGAGRCVPARKRGVGYVPQEGALFPHLDVVGNVAFGLPRTARRGSDARVRAALDLVELPASLAERYPHELSGGQQQRVALARALAPGPSLVLLDEPFASLDAGLREETGRAVVRALRAAGAAAVLVTHDQGEALSLADQVAVMSGGSFRHVAAPHEIYLEPADEDVARFLGHASLLSGTVAGDGSVACALGSLPLRAPAPTGLVRVAVRAEQIDLHHDDGPGVPGVVQDVSFFGHDATARVRLDTTEIVSARTPGDEVPRPGDRVHLEVVGEVVAYPGGAP